VEADAFGTPDQNVRLGTDRHDPTRPYSPESAADFASGNGRSPAPVPQAGLLAYFPRRGNCLSPKKSHGAGDRPPARSILH
jgi:hypothetical protein